MDQANYSTPKGYDESVGEPPAQVLSDRSLRLHSRILATSVVLVAVGLGVLTQDDAVRLKVGSFSFQSEVNDLALLTVVVLFALLVFFTLRANLDIRRFAHQQSLFINHEAEKIINTKGRVQFQYLVDSFEDLHWDLSQSETAVAEKLERGIARRIEIVESITHGWTSFFLEVAVPFLLSLAAITVATLKLQPAYQGLCLPVASAIALAVLIFLIRRFQPSTYRARKELDALENEAVFAYLAWGVTLEIASTTLRDGCGRFHNVPQEKRDEVMTLVLKNFRQREKRYLKTRVLPGS